MLPWVEIAILAVALFLRVWLIEMKPPHFDECVNGWFADQMTQTGFYRYDPTNYHGPLHFYAVFLCQTLFGRHVWAIRLPAIVAGMLCVWALLRYRDFFGLTVSRLAAFAMAVSPGFVFYSRYSIHESWQVLFSLLLVHSLLGLWQTGRRNHLFTAVASVAGLILTKETYILHIGCCMIAFGVLRLWERFLPSRPALAVAVQQWIPADLIKSTALAAMVIVFFYSGTFRDFSALAGLYQTFAAWFQTGVGAGGHEKTTFDLIGPLNYYWVALMARYEWPALLGLATCVRFVFPSDARLRFLAIMGGGFLLAYSIIPYKTPWCIISIIWPFFLTAAAVFDEFRSRLRPPALAWAAAVIPLGASTITCADLNFRKFTDDTEPYVYVQTYEDVNVFTGPLLRRAAEDPRTYHIDGIISMESYYPLPWVLGDFTNIGYYKKEIQPPNWNVSFIAVDSAREAEIESHLQKEYFKRRFHLRSAQDECTAYFLATDFDHVLQGPPEFKPSPAP